MTVYEKKICLIKVKHKGVGTGVRHCISKAKPFYFIQGHAVNPASHTAWKVLLWVLKTETQGPLQICPVQNFQQKVLSV